MTIVVSHAMRRFSPPSPSGNYFAHRVVEDPQCQPTTSSPSGRNCNDLSPRPSMLLTEPWLYGSVRGPPPTSFFLTPALVLCTCPDYINGTKHGTKKGPMLCKKCKGTRLPFHMLEPLPHCASKYGTMRCYPTSTTHAQRSVGFRAGTTRASSSSRPSILPSVENDPYEFLRRSRTTNPDPNSAVVKRSKSPSKSIRNDTFSLRHQSGNKFGTAGRKSILECQINPYDLVEGIDESDITDKSIKFLNGQRIRVRPPLPENDYEDVGDSKINGNEEKKPNINTIQKKSTWRDVGPKRSENGSQSIPVSHPRLNNNEEQLPVSNQVQKTNGNDTYKSILKKSSLYCGKPNGSLTNRKHKSNFYLKNTVRKKVQFSDENEVVKHHVNNYYENVECNNYSTLSSLSENSASSSDEIDEDVSKSNMSEKFKNQNSEGSFNDTIALRVKARRRSLNNNFSDTSVETKLLKPFSKNIPSRPPPPLPPPKIEEIKVNDDEISQGKQTFDNCAIINTPTLEETEIFKEKVTQDLTEDEIIQKQKSVPPLAPPRKKNHRQNYVNIVNESFESKTDNEEDNNQDYSDISLQQVQFNKTTPSIVTTPKKTIVQIRSTPEEHKIQIKNEFSPIENTNYIQMAENNQRKTSILINGDNCYSTVNVSDDTPIYLSSVVVTDANMKIVQTCSQSNVEETSVQPSDNSENKSIITVTCGGDDFKDYQATKSNPVLEEKDDTTPIENSENIKLTGNDNSTTEVEDKEFGTNEVETTNEKDIEETKIFEEVDEIVEKIRAIDDPEKEEKQIKQILRNPVEAVRLNLVPHVCGKSDDARKSHDRLTSCCSFTDSSETHKSVDYDRCNVQNKILFSDLTNNSMTGKDSSITSTDTGNSSMHYESMEQESDFYTDHSNRSSVAEDDSTIRSKFYELLADSTITELTDDHQYECIRNNTDPIYEEIEVPPPLPTSPPPKNIIDDLQLDKQITTRSIFEGASKYDILSYLVDAKERGIIPEDSYVFGNSEVIVEEEIIKDQNTPYNRSSHMSSVSDSSEDSSLILPCAFADEKSSYQKSAEVERNDSGVGSETSKVSLTKYRHKLESVSNCEDCEAAIEVQTENEALLCRKCLKRRSERKEIITEIVETEEKYSRDLQIILEEFYQPMLVAGLLTQEQLSAIFLNVEELLENSQALAERLRDAVEIAAEQGDEDLLTVNIGKLFLEAAPMLHAFETYCVRQAGASLLLASLEKDKELLRIFLRVSQMENTMLRRMNLNSFLMVPVQRVTKYPLLLARLYKATPLQHETREQLMEAKHQIELHLNHMNSETKDVPSKLWRRIGSSSGRRLSTEMDLVSIKLRKIAVDVLEWNHEEAKFALEGKLFFTQPTDNNWRKGRTIKLTPVNALLVTNGKNSFGNRPDRLSDDSLRFPKGSGIREAALLLVRDKNGRYSLLRDPLYLDRCVIATDPAWHSYFEVQEVIGKDTFIFKAEDEEMTQTWYKELQFHAQGLGIWRKRRNALANIMINGMGLRT